MKKTPNDLLADIRHNLAIARHALEKTDVLVGTFIDLYAVPSGERGTSGPPVGALPHRKPKSLMTWVEWLAANGPAYRQDIQAATGINLASNAAPHVLSWKWKHETLPDDRLPADTLFKIAGPQTALGRPKSIYFLWSQRWDVHDRFGVGPERPSEPVEAPETPVEPSEPLQTLLGVVRPPEGTESATEPVEPSSYEPGPLGEPIAPTPSGGVTWSWGPTPSLDPDPDNDLEDPLVWDDETESEN